MTYENIMAQVGKIWKNIQTTQTKETLAQLSAEDKQLLVLMQKILKAQQAGQTQAEVLALVKATKKKLSHLPTFDELDTLFGSSFMRDYVPQIVDYLNKRQLNPIPDDIYSYVYSLGFHNMRPTKGNYRLMVSQIGVWLQEENEEVNVNIHKDYMAYISPEIIIPFQSPGMVMNPGVQNHPVHARLIVVEKVKEDNQTIFRYHVSIWLQLQPEF